MSYLKTYILISLATLVVLLQGCSSLHCNPAIKLHLKQIESVNSVFDQGIVDFGKSLYGVSCKF